jgi:hypothetical protein
MAPNEISIPTGHSVADLTGPGLQPLVHLSGRHPDWRGP